jgi:hypothetical protein
MIGPFNNLGEPFLPLKDSYPYGITFIGRYLTPTITEPVEGTGFLVAMEGVNENHVYVVTAKHVVEDIPRTFVRLNMFPQGATRDVPVERWYPHPTFDVAVAPIDLPDGSNMAATGIDEFVDDPSLAEDGWFQRGVKLELGEVVYFIGLFKGIAAMSEGNVPMVRSGTLGRLWQEDCPVRIEDARSPDGYRVEYITAHLIDCRSYSGFSGSPCYIQQSRAGVSDGGVTTKYRTLLLGLIAGHYDEDAPAWHATGKSDLFFETNTGIGYVIPAEFIRDALLDKDLVKMRKKRDEKKPPERGAKQDRAQSVEESEFERFTNATKFLVNTPKPKKDDEG